MRRRRYALLATLALTAFASAGAAQVGTSTLDCPCASYGPYPCAAFTLAILPEQADRLGLSEAELEALLIRRRVHLEATHEILYEIAGLREALHLIERPRDASEAFALFYDLGAHEAELAAAFEAGAADLLALLTEPQRDRWTALLVEASGYQEEAAGCRAVPAP